jgi:tetratricopeptide (TPR) repeat protein
MEKGPLLGRMLYRYSKLLRSHGHELDLVNWKNIVLKEEGERPEALEVVLTVYEYQLNKRRYSQLVETAQDIVKLYPTKKKLELFPKAQKMLLDTAECLQTLIVKNKGAKEVGDLSKILAQVYDAFTQVVDESDPRIPRVHYNLAETLFTIKDYDGATRHYRWVVDHGTWKDTPKHAKNSLDPEAPLATVPDASLKAIASRYEVLRTKGQIPSSLTARSESDNSDRTLDTILAEWIQWIDTHVEHTFDDMDNFYFEGNRVLYSQGHVVQATERLRKFSFKHSSSSYAIPSASLVIDTYIAGKQWKRTYELATDLMDVKEWKDTAFGKRLFSVAADSSYKQIEMLYNSHEYSDALGAADDFLKKYASSSRLADTLSLAGNSAMNSSKRDKALIYFSRLIAEAPKAGTVGNALLARAQLEEERYNFAEAGSDYRSYLSLPTAQQVKADSSQLESLRKKALLLSWLSGDPEKLRVALESKAVCTDSLADDCLRYKLLGRILVVSRSDSGKLGEDETAQAFDAARKGSGELRTLYSVLALEGLSHLAFRDRLHVARWASSGWDSLDPIVKFSLLPSLTVTIPKAFAANRVAMKDVAPLRADEKYITHRVDVIREMENAATDVMKLPWARIRAEVLSELASLYLDLSHGLSTLPPPKGLSTEDLAQYDAVIHKLILPFEEKGQDMRGKAFEIASRSAVEEESFHKIADPFFEENPSQAKALRPVSEVAAPAPLDLSLLALLDDSGGWKLPKGSLSKIEDPTKRLKAAWMLAVQSRTWPQVAFFMNETQNKAVVQSGVMGIVKAVSLAAAGARGEALAELEDTKRDLDPIARNVVVTTLLQYSLRACSREHTLALLKDVKTETLSRDQAALVSHATNYAADRRPTTTR